MPMDPSWSSIAPNRWTPAAARHVLQRAGFGGDARAIADLHARGLDAAVDSFITPDAAPPATPADVDPDVIRPFSSEQRRSARESIARGDESVRDRTRQQRQAALREDRAMFRELQRWWLDLMRTSDAPLNERLVLLWHNHFATGHRAVRDAFLMYRQNVMFREHAYDFAALARGIIRDPAMLKYLNNDRNSRRSPNENLARELMELFTLGEGNYAEADIKEGARALTGYGVDDNDFVFRRAQHDPSAKTILGAKGDYDGDDFVDRLLKRDACPRFVALKLYDHFVYDVGDDWDKVSRDRQRVIQNLGELVKRHGYDLTPVIRRVLTSRHFHDPANVGRKVRSPAHLLMGTLRTLGTPTRSARVLAEAMEQMGQVVFEPPSVNGWDGGRAWINTSTLYVRQNLSVYLITGKRSDAEFDARSVNYDPTPLLTGLDDRNPHAVVDHLVDALLGPHVPEPRRDALYAFARGRERGADDPQALIGLLCMVTAMPEYQLC